MHFLYQLLEGPEALCHLGNKNPPTPKIPTMACTSFIFLGIGKACIFSRGASMPQLEDAGQDCFQVTANVTHQNPMAKKKKTLWPSLGLEFPAGSLRIFSLKGVPAKMAVCPTARADHLIHIISLMQWVHFTDVEKENSSGSPSANP